MQSPNANLNGEDLTTLIERITAADLTGARSISAVLHGRLAWTGKSQGTLSTWAQRTPENAPQLAHEAAKAIDDRITALGMRWAEKPEPWLTSQLGAFPVHGSALEQQDYLHRAGSAAAYREAAGIVDPHQAVSLTPHKGDPVVERMRQDTITQLEFQNEEQLYQGMSRGELEAKELHARRAYAAGPKDVAAELKNTDPGRSRPAAGGYRGRARRATRRPRRPCTPSPTSSRLRRRHWKPITPGTSTGQPRPPGAAKTGRRPAPSSPAAARHPKPGPRRRHLNGGSASNATARPSTST